MNKLYSCLVVFVVLFGMSFAGLCQECKTGCDTVGYCNKTYSHGACTGAKLRVQNPISQCRYTGKLNAVCWNPSSLLCYTDYSADCSCTPVLLITTGTAAGGC